MNNNFRMNRWNWGLSDDKLAWAPSSFQEWTWMEIRENPFSLTLQKSYDEIGITGTLTSILSLRDDLNAYWITDGWYIYTISPDGSTSTLRTDFTTWVLSAIEWDGVVYFCTDTDIFSIPSNELATWTPTDIWNLDAWWVKRMLIFKESLFLSWWTYVYQYTIDKYLSVEVVWEVVDIIPSWDYLKVFSSTWNDTTVTFVEVSYWDITDISHKESKTWKWTSIISSINKNWLEYLFSSEWIYISQWFSKDLIKRRKIEPSLTVTAIDNSIYLWSGNDVYSFWSFTKDYPECLNKEVELNIPITIVGSKWDLVISWWNWAMFIHNREWTTYQNRWYIKSRVYYWSTAIDEKDAIELKVWYMPLPQNTSITINLYANMSDVPEYSILLDEEWSMSKTLTTSFPFNFLEVEVVMETTDWLNTPELLDLLLYFSNTD